MLDSHRQSLHRDLNRARDAHARALESTPFGYSYSAERQWNYELENLRWWWAQEPRMPGVRAAMRAHHTWGRWAEAIEENNRD